MITLNASARYGYGGKQFIARIVGRHPKFVFNYEFIGKKGGKRNEDSSADVDTPGMYVTRDIDSKGRCDDSFIIIIEAEGVLLKLGADKEDAMKIGKALDAGRPLDEQVWAWRSDEMVRQVKAMRAACKHEAAAEVQAKIDARIAAGEHVRQSAGWEFVTPRQAEKAAAAATIDGAVADCYRIIAALPIDMAKKVLAQLRKMITPPNPPRSGARPLSPDAPIGVLQDYAEEHGVTTAELNLTRTPVLPLAVGETVECLDATDGSHFLVVGQQYQINAIQTTDAGATMIFLDGMAKGWEPSRFARAEQKGAQS